MAATVAARTLRNKKRKAANNPAVFNSMIPLPLSTTAWYFLQPDEFIAAGLRNSPEGFFTSYILGTPVTFVGPNLAHQFGSLPNAAFPLEEGYKFLLRGMFGEDVFHKLPRLTHRLLTSTRMRSNFGGLRRAARRCLRENLAGGRQVELKRFASFVTSYTIMEYLFGLDSFQTITPREFAGHLHDVDIDFRIWEFFLPLPAHMSPRLHRRNKMLESLRVELQHPSWKTSDFLTLFNGSDDVAAYEPHSLMWALIWGGHANLTFAIVSLLLALLRDDEAMKRVQADIASAGDDLDALQYLPTFITDVLRQQGTGQFWRLSLVDNNEFEGRTIPKGELLTFPISPKLRSFDTPTAEEASHPERLVLFGQGRHPCLGRFFAVEMMKLIIVLIVSNITNLRLDNANVAPRLFKVPFPGPQILVNDVTLVHDGLVLDEHEE